MSLYGARRLEVGNHISPKGIEVNKVKVEVIEKLPTMNYVKAVRSVLGMSGSIDILLKIFQR